LKKILYFLLVLLAAPLMLACNEDDSVDYTEYYGWRDENNAVTELFLSAQSTVSALTYFNQRVQSLKEPQYYPSFYHFVHRANLDSLRNLNPRKDYRPYSTSTLSVHYTLYQTDSLYAKVRRQGGWTKEYLRNPGGLLDSLFFACADRSPLKADTIESYQVKYYTGFTPNGVITGWGDILQQMYIGDHVVCMIPWYLAYGQQGSGSSINPYSNLFFQIELCDITAWGGNVANK
jgi:hypothetical protein